MNWYNYDGTLLYTATVNEGDQAVYGGEYPTRAADESYTYTFSGWDQDTSYVTYDMTVTAQYSAEAIIVTHMVYWQNYDASVLYSTSVNDGEAAVYGGEYPTKPADESYTYTFSGWDLDTSSVTSDMLVTAQYTAEAIPPTEYLVTFIVNEDPLAAPPTEYVEEGSAANDPGPVNVEGYSFDGWYQAGSDEPYDFSSEVYENVELQAEMSEVKAKANLIFELGRDDIYNSDAFKNQELDIGDEVTEPEKPVVIDNVIHFYNWYTDEKHEKACSFPFTIDGETHLYAEFRYEVTFDVQGIGAEPEGQMVKEGEKPTYQEIPSETVGDYQFDGWCQDAEGNTAFSFDDPIYKNTVVYAKWKKVPAPVTMYDVTFDMQGHGEQVAAQQVEEGQTAVKPDPAPTAEGWTFDGWYKEAACENVFEFADPIMGTTIIYAKWNANPVPKYDVTFDMQGHGEAPAAQQVEEGQTAVKPANPTAEGWTFGGWYKEAACENVFEFADPIMGATTIYAKWSENPVITYQVTFDMQGHGTAPAAQTVEDGKTATQPADPTAEGYSFGGWYKEAACENLFKFEEPITAATTIYAKWTENPVPVTKYTVTFDVQGHGEAPAAQTVEEGKAPVKPADPTAEGWIFGGWYSEAACTNAYDFGKGIYQDTVIYAKWTAVPPATYVVTFSYNGRAADPYATATVTDGQTVAKPADPSVPGYIFGGWYTDTACTTAYDFSTPIKEYKILYAKWTEEPTVIEKYSVTFYTEHGVTPDGQLVDKNQKVIKPADPAAPGYIFGGWYSDFECTNPYDFNTPVTYNMTLFAKWTEEPTTIQYFTVSFYTEWGIAPGTQTVEKGYPAVKPVDPTAEGYVFGGWYTDRELTSLYDFNTPVMSNMTLFAKWTQLPVQNYVVYFNSNGHGNTPNPQTVKSGELVQKPVDPTATGYTFTGWYTDPSCTQAYNFREPVYSDMALYAGWTPNRYTIKFDSNGGVGTMASISCVYDTKAMLSPNAFTRTGYYFMGWNTAADGTGTLIADRAEICNLTDVNGGTVNLYAQWKNMYNVIEGANAKVMKGGKEGITFRVDGDYSKFTGIRIDNNNVSTTQYTSWSGSTYVQLHADYVNQMPNGEHTIRFMFTDGAVETKFEVVSGTPKTGDTNNALIWILIAILALVIIIVVVIIILVRRRSNTDYRDPDRGRYADHYGDRDDDEFIEDDRYDDRYEDDGDDRYRR